METLSKLVTDIPLERSHHITVTRMVLDALMEMERFGFAAQLIKKLLTHPLHASPSKVFESLLQSKLEICLERAKSTPIPLSQEPPYVCPCCGHTPVKDEALYDSCEKCKTRIRFSYRVKHLTPPSSLKLIMFLFLFFLVFPIHNEGQVLLVCLL